MDGWVIIGTELDTKPLDKKLSKLENKLKNQELDFKIKTDNLEKAKNELKELGKEAQEVTKRQKELSKEILSRQKEHDAIEKKIFSGQAIQPNEYLKRERLLKELAPLKKELEEVTKEADRYNKKINDSNDKLVKATNQYNKQQEKIRDTKNEIAQVNNETKKNNLQDVENRMENISGSAGNIVKKIAKWGLAIFSVRSAYNFIRQSVSTLSQYNEKLATDIEYIRYALASSLQPLIEKMIQLVYKLMAYINYISQAWFGINIFANASVKSFEKVKKGISGANKQAKELQKTLAGFDEMNILQDGSTTTGGGGGGVTLPSYDLSGMGNIEIPSWIKWIADHKEIVIGVLEAAIVAIAGIKYGLQGIAALGIALALVNVINLVKDLISYFKNPSLKGFVSLLEDLEGVLIGVGIAMVALNAANPVGWIMLATSLLVDLTKKLFENKAAIKDVEKAERDLKNARRDVVDAQQKYANAVDESARANRNLAKVERDTGYSGRELYNQVQRGTLTYEKMNEKQKLVYKAYLETIQAQDDLTNSKQELNEKIKKEIDESLELQLSNAKEKNSYDELKKSVIEMFDEGKISSAEAKDYFARAMADMSKESKETFMTDIPNNLKAGLDPHKYDSTWTKFKNWFNKNIRGLDTTVKINFVSTGGGGAGGFGGGTSGGRAKGGIFYPSKLPRLAKGGIVNMPGPGIPYHGAVIGERGAEAVVPLTDSQQMSLLGATIGKNVTIAATIPVYVGNRQVAREIRKIDASDEFAFNR